MRFPSKNIQIRYLANRLSGLFIIIVTNINDKIASKAFAIITLQIDPGQNRIISL